MLIGERVKIARRAAGMSQRDLAKVVGVSAMAISKYERGLSVPGSVVFANLVRALGVKTEYFLRPVSVTLSAPSYRRRQSLPHKRETSILAHLQDWLERYLDVESFFREMPHFDLPADLDCHAPSLGDVERIALGVREAWQLGQSPIESLVEVLEDRGIKVGLVDGHDDLDALAFWANEKVPVIAVKRGLPGARQRLNLAHELGHLVLKPADDVDGEKAACRFAGAFLVTGKAARFELGRTRQTLNLLELHLLKHKYGLSMQAWICRARDLGILSDFAASQLLRGFRRKGWRRREPGDPIPPEEPARMLRLVLRALSEDIISESRAAELLGMPLSQFWQQEARICGVFAVDIRA